MNYIIFVCVFARARVWVCEVYKHSTDWSTVHYINNTIIIIIIIIFFIIISII